MQMRTGHQPSPNEPRITTARWALQRAAEISAEAAQNITRLGVRTIGDISALGAMSNDGAQTHANVTSETSVVSTDSAAQAIVGAVIAAGATGERPGIEDQQIRDADAATLVRVLKKRSLQRARMSLKRRS
jgi:hypothetical protein